MIKQGEMEGMEYKYGKTFSWHDSMFAFLEDGRKVKIKKIEAVEGIFYQIIFTTQAGRGFQEEIRLVQDLSPFEKVLNFDKLAWQV